VNCEAPAENKRGAFFVHVFLCDNGDFQPLYLQ